MNWFVNYIYREANYRNGGTSFAPGQNPTVDSLATKIALQTGVDNGWAPTLTLSLLNSGLGTNFTLTDYNRSAKEFGFPTVAVETPPAPAPAPATVVQSPSTSDTNLFTVVENNPFIQDGLTSASEEVRTVSPAVQQATTTNTINLPVLPANAASLSPEDKGRLYNTLISQGYTDAEIRIASGQQTDQDWNALKQIAEQVKTAATQPAQTTATTTQQAAQTTQSPYASWALTPEEVQTAVASIVEGIPTTFSKGNLSYVVNADGTYRVYGPEDANKNFDNVGFSADGKVIDVVADNDRPTIQRSLANAAAGALVGAVLGPAGAGLLGGTAAGAAGAGAGSLIGGGSAEDALKAAALGGLVAAGVGQVLPGTSAAVDDFVAADVAQLAAQGIPEEQIAQILTQEGVAGSVINAALDTQFGTSAPGSAKGLGDFTGTTASANQVVVTGQNAGLGALSTVSPALSTVVPLVTAQPVTVTGNVLTGAETPPTETISTVVGSTVPLVTSIPSQQVEVTGQQTQQQQTVPSTVGPVVSNIVPSQQVQVTDTKTTPEIVTEETSGGLLSGVTQSVPVTGQTLTTATTTPTTTVPATTGSALGTLVASEKVPVTGQKVTTTEKTPVVAGSAAGTLLPATTETTTTTKDTTKQESLFSPSDILKLFSLLNTLAAAGASTGGGGVVPVRGIPPSDTMLGSTTPQFGPDYYAAVQQYYNAYMPETPRNVAGPLQQWYENKYGA